MPAALVTGGAKRIGRAIALGLADDGWDLAIHYRTSAAEAEDTAAEARTRGVTAQTFAGDLGDPETIESLVENVHRAVPDLALLINNASIFDPGALRDCSVEQWDRVVDVNLRAPFVLTREFSRIVDSGSIINLLDSTVEQGRSGFAAYSVSKAGLQLLTRVAAQELAPSIRVNAIAPGPVLAPPGKGIEHLEAAAERTPLRSPVGVEDILAAVRYLVRNRSVTGEVLYVDGGEHLVGESI
jgi:NAD(P)-dependent dehydrogenase (short-subunit alcohol dehydrogenase family)